ncbi:MAG: NUDIX domain-containing protein [Sedimentitalea sp.]
MIRRFGQRPDPARRYRQRSGVYAILPRNGAVLLTLQQEDSGPDLQLPGGGIDSGESPLAALHREVLEETGWRIANPRRLGAFRRFVFMPEYNLWAEKMCHIYLARPVLSLGPAQEIGHEPFWADITIAANLLKNPGDQYFLSRFSSA